MSFLNSWLQGIMIAVIVSTIIQMILPNSSSKKYIKVVLGVYVVFNIIAPVVNQFFNSDFELSSIFNMEEYETKMETYEVNSKNIDKSNENNIKEIYVSNLKKDMETKLQEKGYKTKKIQIEIANDDTYKIKSINLSLEKQEDEESNKEETITNKIDIEQVEIEKVEIQVGESSKKENIESSPKIQITEKEKKEIKQYIVNVYEVKENQINIE